MAKNKKNINRVLVAAIVVFAGIFAWNKFAIGDRFKISAAVDDMLHNRQPDRARARLQDMPDRARVVTALKAALDQDTDSVWGKGWVLDMLSGLKESRAVRRAIDSEVESTRRAAAYLFHNRKPYQKRSGRQQRAPEPEPKPVAPGVAEDDEDDQPF